MEGINQWAVLLATFAGFFLRLFWYSNKAFGIPWERVSAPHPSIWHKLILYPLALIFSWVTTLVFAIYLGPNPDLISSIGAGLGIGVCFVATSFSTNYLFAGKSLVLLLIDVGYYIVQFTLYGIILGLLK